MKADVFKDETTNVNAWGIIPDKSWKLKINKQLQRMHEMPIINNVLITEACPLEHGKFPDSKFSTLVTSCEHTFCQDNKNCICESNENAWRRLRK